MSLHRYFPAHLIFFFIFFLFPFFPRYRKKTNLSNRNPQRILPPLTLLFPSRTNLGKPIPQQHFHTLRKQKLIQKNCPITSELSIL